MAFGFDDIAVAIGEVAGKVAETAEEVTTIAGDGVEESARNAGKLYSKLVENTEECVTELQKESSPSIPQIEGDGIPEQTSTIEQVPEQRNIEDMQSSDDNDQQSIEREDNTTLDDNGKPFIKDGELLPNNTYEINGVKYETDDKGRIIRAEATVEINNAPRPSLNSRKVGGLEPGDDKGHIIAHVLGGSDSEGNLVAQDAKLNRGEYKSMELSAKRAREEGKVVTMTVEIEYEGDSKRPKSFTVTLEIDDEITVKKFLNNSNGQNV